ncbi:SHOCT-like domain-containing protein [Anaerocolumna xylanovorans]|uniref:YvlB/LiaX N-terminal domain-containing protein n=1 Tax=Anaerocolumna xylanovorans DSM 12503 TaxID=1121345 RepID=A0A1M7XWY1_9FIRM|nr:hypothetical protein [Anaerocolumna xylanovorans]SHO43345.1 hypothetical protein SAMN02745217_00195 [Anaerocolumna xylanovorans DSM 12503]
MNEQLKILEMIEKGQITAAEGMELLEALGSAKETSENSESKEIPVQNPVIRKSSYKFLKIKVTSDNKTVNVNVNIPLGLITTLGEVTGKVLTHIPPDAKVKMESKGVYLSDIDFQGIIRELLNGTLDDPDIVDVEAWDEDSKSMIRVKIYVE